VNPSLDITETFFQLLIELFLDI
jgi:hypothetical protein